MSEMVRVDARVPAKSLSSAAIGLGLERSMTTRSGVVRAALALFHGKDRETAYRLAMPTHNSRLSADKGSERVGADVEAELANTGDAKISYAIRVGLGMAAGFTRAEAEEWAAMIKPGRPRKVTTDA